MMFRFIKNVIFLAAAVYCGALAYYTYYQRDFMYHPNDSYTSLQRAGAIDAFEELSVKTEDNVFLKGWYAPATKKKGTIVFFHGNADHLLNVLPIATRYVEAGYGFLIAEYRGYSRLSGNPTENGLYADARAFIYKLFEKGIDVNHLVVMGHSLGSGVATQVSTEFHPAGLVLLAPLSSMAELAKVHHPYFPSEFLVFDKYDNAAKIKTLPTPVLIVHGDADNVVPLAQGQKLYDLANEPKQIEVLLGRNHSDIFDDAFWHVSDFVDMLMKRAN